MYIKKSDEEVVDEMLAVQLQSEDKIDEEKGKVTVVVTIDEELLRRIEASVQSGSAVEEGLTKS